MKRWPQLQKSLLYVLGAPPLFLFAGCAFKRLKRAHTVHKPVSRPRHLPAGGHSKASPVGCSSREGQKAARCLTGLPHMRKTPPLHPPSQGRRPWRLFDG
jgi:hypothetical protein